MFTLIGALPFGIDGIKILLHLFNFAILAVGLTFLLYKPVLKFINKRRESIQSEIQKGEQLQADATSKMDEYQSKLSSFEEERKRIIEQAEAEAKQSKEALLEKAEAEAAVIKQNAEAEAEAVRKEAVADCKDELADIAVKLAGEIIKREISKADNQKLIDDCLNNWVENGK